MLNLAITKANRKFNYYLNKILILISIFLCVLLYVAYINLHEKDFFYTWLNIISYPKAIFENQNIWDLIMFYGILRECIQRNSNNNAVNWKREMMNSAAR